MDTNPLDLFEYSFLSVILEYKLNVLVKPFPSDSPTYIYIIHEKLRVPKQHILDEKKNNYTLNYILLLY